MSRWFYVVEQLSGDFKKTLGLVSRRRVAHDWFIMRRLSHLAGWLRIGGGLAAHDIAAGEFFDLNE